MIDGGACIITHLILAHFPVTLSSSLQDSLKTILFKFE